MKRSLVVAAAALVLASAGQANPRPASLVWTGVLTPEAAGATGSGAMFLEYFLETNVLLIQTTFAGLSGNVTVAHIHCCTATPLTGTAGVAILAPTLTGFPAGGTSGTYSGVFDLDLASSWSPSFIAASGGTPQSATTRLIGAFGSGTAYLNVHSTTFTGGEIRAFAIPSPIPEPGTWALMALGLGAVGFAARRRQSKGRPGRKPA